MSLLVVKHVKGGVSISESKEKVPNVKVLVKERPCKNHMDNNPKTYLDTIYFRNNIKWQKKV